MIIQEVKPLDFSLIEPDAPPAPFSKRSFQLRFELSHSAPRHQFVRIRLFAFYSCYLAHTEQQANFSADMHFVSSSHIRYFERKEGQHLKQFLVIIYKKAADRLAALLKEQHGPDVQPFLSVLQEDDGDLGTLLERAANEAVLLDLAEGEDQGRFL